MTKLIENWLILLRNSRFRGLMHRRIHRLLTKAFGRKNQSAAQLGERRLAVSDRLDEIVATVRHGRRDESCEDRWTIISDWFLDPNVKSDHVVFERLVERGHGVAFS